MDNDVTTQAKPVLELLQDQLDVLLAMISRPAVQEQILAVLVIVLIAWLLPEGLRRWRQRRGPVSQEDQATDVSLRRRWLAALYQLVTPILAGVLLNVVILLFAQRGLPNGLLIAMANLIWIWVVYRLLIAYLYARYGEAARPYQNRIITPVFAVLALWYFLTILPRTTSILNTIISLGSISITLGKLINALIILYLFFVTAWVIKQIMLQTLPSRLNSEPGVIESVATLTRYAVLASGIIIALGALGLDFTSLAIIAGGLSVGIGIGLQDIVSNFVSGLVLLFEQSLRPGDVVELDGRISQVEKISLRATTVRTRTNEELILPNNTFTNHQVKNLTKSDRLVQVKVPLGVSYKSDPETVRRLAVETALHHPQVLAEPAPEMRFLGYGESSLDFELWISVNQPESSLSIRSDLYYSLWQVFAEHGIEIPFPQRDLNLGDGWEKLAADLQTN